MSTTIQTQYVPETPMVIPLLDAEGDLADVAITPTWRWCAGQYWNSAVDPVDPVEYEQGNGLNEMVWATLACMAQDFQYRNSVGWGELGGSATADSAGTWIEPAESPIGVG